MKRIISLLVCMLLVITSLMARTPEQAAKVASGFLSTRGTQMSVAQRAQRAARVTAVPADVTMVYTQLQKDSQEPAVYVFNGERDGFVLVSAGDEGRVVLGYSDSGKFDKDDIPANMQFWLQMYADELASSVATPSKAPAKGSLQKMSKAAAASYPTVYPILDGVKWGQGEPFNNNCPVATSGDKTVTGCVATAISQIMYAHKYPDYGTGSHSYYCQSLGATLSADFSSTYLNWDQMKGNYNVGYTTAQANAVATLMYNVGVASEMSYGVDGSGAFSTLALYNMTEYFGYDKGVVPQPKGCLPESDILNAIATDLQAGRPVYMDGRTVNDEGHAFLCDGIQSDGYLHINWGWYGNCDGYFAFSALDPDNQGTGGSVSNSAFTEMVVAYTNIKPDEDGEVVPMWTSSGLYRTSGAESTRYSYNYFNLQNLRSVGLGTISNGGMVLDVYNSNGYWVAQYSIGSFELPAGYFYPNYPFNFYIGSDLSDGSYTVEVSFKDNNGQKTPVLVEGQGVARIPMTVSGDAVYFGETSAPEEYEHTIHIRKGEGCTMDLSSGAWLWYWLPDGSAAGIVEMSLETYRGNDWYTATIVSQSSEINCLVVNKNVYDDGWSGCEQTVDFEGVTGNVCLEVGGFSTTDYETHKYLLTQTDCGENSIEIRVTLDAGSSMDVSSGLWIWWWLDNQGGHMVKADYNGTYYSATISTEAEYINCLVTNGPNWDEVTAQTKDFEGVYGDICLAVGNYLESVNGKECYAIGKVDCETGAAPDLDLNLTHGYSYAYGDMNDELHLWSEDEGTKMCFDLYCDYANSILGTYIVQNNNNTGCCYTNYSYIEHNGNKVSLSSGYVTIVKDAVGDFVLSFDVYDVGGNHYVNTCTISASRIGLENNADISGTGVTALTPLEAKTITENLTHTDLTDIPFLVKGVVSTMRNTPDQIITYGSARFDISEDGSSVDQFYCYNTKWLNNTSCTTGYEIELGDEVVVYGNLQNYLGSTPEIKGYVYQSIKASGIYYSLDVIASQGGYVDIYPMEDAYAAGSYVSLTAVAYEGYHFLGWSDDVTDASRTIQMNSNISLEAYFEVEGGAGPADCYTLTLYPTADANEGGYAYAAPSFNCYEPGTDVIIRAHAFDGYVFVRWNDGNTDAERTIVMNANSSYTAYFELEQTAPCYTLTIAETVGGEVILSPEKDCYEQGEQVTLFAMADEGYRFVRWSDGNTDMQRILSMNSDVMLSAIFEQITYTLVLQESEGGYSVATPDKGQYLAGEQVTVEAIAYEDYQFVCWNDGNSEQERVLRMDKDYVLQPTFVGVNIPEGFYTLILTHTEGGSVTKSPDNLYYESGDVVYVEALPNDGYEFINWSDGETDKLRRITVTENITLHANFAEIVADTQYTLTLTAGTGGSVSASPSKATYNEGEMVVINAVAEENYKFEKWNDGVLEARRVIEMNENKTFHATFKRIPTDYDVTDLSITGSSLRATAQWKSAAEWYRVVVVNASDAEIKNEVKNITGDKKKYSFTAPRNGTYTITIEPLDNTDEHASLAPAVSGSVTLRRLYSLEIVANNGGTVNDEVNATNYEYGAEVQIVATPKEGYRFLNWSDENTEATRTLTMDQDYYLEANFKRIPTYTLTIYEGEHCTASLEPGSYTYQENHVITLTPIAEDGYEFVHWIVNGIENPTSELQLVMTMNYDVYPVAKEIPKPTYTLTILDSEFGTTSIAPGVYTYSEKEMVTITATANEDYIFDRWMVNGEASSTDNILALTMLMDYVVEATFKPNKVAVDNVYTDILINVQQRTLYVQASMSMDMAIYDLVGHLLHRKNNTTSLVYDLPAAGVYILRTGDGVQKIRIE